MSDSPYGFWLPINVSAHGATVDQLINILHWFMGTLFIGWGIFLVYCLIRFRARPGYKPLTGIMNFKMLKYFVLAVLLFEESLVFFFAYPIWAKVKNEFPAEQDSVIIRVVAEQFAWNFHYPGRDGKFGKTRMGLIDGINPLGLDRDDPDAKDDITTVNILHIPVNKPVIAHLSSKDMIHSFSIPVMRVKQDIVPGMTVPIWFEANQTGEFEVACAQLCGIGHYTMRASLKIDTAEEFNRWLSEEGKSLLGVITKGSSHG